MKKFTLENKFCSRIRKHWSHSLSYHNVEEEGREGKGKKMAVRRKRSSRRRTGMRGRSRMKREKSNILIRECNRVNSQFGQFHSTLLDCPHHIGSDRPRCLP
jgi:hypothetical protein